MFAQRLFVAAMTLALAGHFWQHCCAQAPGVVKEANSAAADSQEAERRAIMTSDRWRRMLRDFNDWMAVQQAYTEEQLTEVRADLAERLEKMSPRELEVFLKDMEDRLAVLASPEAKDAREWLAQFLAVARNPEAQLGRSRPDVLNMSANQIRQELRWLEQHRLARQQSHAAFQQGRALQKQAAQGFRDNRQQTLQRDVKLRSSAAAQANARIQERPDHRDRPNFVDFQLPTGPPVYSVSPWGTPIYWHPMRGQWGW